MKTKSFVIAPVGWWDYFFNRRVWVVISETRIQIPDWDHNFPDNLLGYSDGVITKYMVTDRVTGEVTFEYRTTRI